MRCAAGTVRAPIVLRATESYTTQLRGQRPRYLPLYSLMIATAPLPDEVWATLAWRDGLLIDDSHYLFFYAQRTTDGRIAIGGRGAPYRLRSPIDLRNERNEHVRARLVRTLARAFPAAADAPLTHHWGGPLAVPRDWSMAIAFDRASGVGFAGGYTGHGVAAANISGRTLADLVLGRDSDLDDDAVGRPPQPRLGARADPLPRLDGDRPHARRRRPPRGRDRPPGSPGPAAATVPAAALSGRAGREPDRRLRRLDEVRVAKRGASVEDRGVVEGAGGQRTGEAVACGHERRASRRIRG